jgi:outer membrane lipase/esterase
MFRKFFRKILASLLLASSVVAAGSASAAGFTNMYVFGDSYSDSGNSSSSKPNWWPSSDPWLGRWSNGPTYAEDLAGMLGLTLAPSSLGGTNYAMAGAGIGGVLNQVNTFRNLSGPADPNALYVVWGGINNLLGSPGQAAVANVSQGLWNAISGLYDEGARSFLVIDMPDLGLIPQYHPSGYPYPGYTYAGWDESLSSKATNEEIYMTIGNARRNLYGITVYDLDTYYPLQDVIFHPQNYGLTNVIDSFLSKCPITATSCNYNPDSFLFWDNVHLTAAGHRIIAEAAYAAIPEPETYAMLLAGLGLLGFTARRRKQNA